MKYKIVVLFFSLLLYACNTKSKEKFAQVKSDLERIDTIPDSIYVSVKKNSKIPKKHPENEDPNYQTDDIKVLETATNISDMSIIIKGSDGTINMFFDADNYGLKMQVLSENQTMYADEQGFVYINSPKEGWIKTNMSQMFGAMAKMVPIDLGFVPFESKKGTVFHKIAAFAAEVTISKLEKEPRAKKISGGIGKEKAVFLADDHVTVTFDSFKRLESITEGSSKINYYYEEQHITFPNAKLMAMPSFN
jgi:hypothetical protein